MKRKNVGIVASLIALKSKVFASGEVSKICVNTVLYGPPRPSILEMGLKAFQIIIAPILFLIGIIIYLKKSKSSKKRKIITTLIWLLLVIGVYYGIEFLIEYIIYYF